MREGKSPRLYHLPIQDDKHLIYSILLDQCIKIYGDIPWFKPQAARASWKKGKLLLDLGNEIEGKAQLARAMDFRRQIDPKDKREEEDLVDKDWDELVWFYSR